MLTSALADIGDLRHEVQDSNFNADEYLESFIQRNMGLTRGNGSGDGAQLMNLADSKRNGNLNDASKGRACFDPERLLQSFNDLFDSLVMMNKKFGDKFAQAEAALVKTEKQTVKNLTERLEQTEQNMIQVENFEKDVSDLARRIYTLSDSINAVSEPQERLKEARKILTHFMELNQDSVQEFTFPELTKPRKTIEDFQQAASTILRLYRIAKDMGTAEDKIYSKARDRIFELYSQLQNDLINLFINAHRERPIDLTTMKRAALVLQNFPAGQSQCVANFIQRSADTINIQTFSGPSYSYQSSTIDIFQSIDHLCDVTWKLIEDIFPSPDAIMEKFLLYVIQEKLQVYVKQKLEGKGQQEGRESYLRDLYELSKKAKALESKLMEKYKQFRFDKAMRAVFEPYISSYVQTECNFLRGRCGGMVQQYYDAIFSEWNLVKPLGPIQVLSEKKDFFNVMAAKTIPSTISDFLKENPAISVENKILSESLALNILHELRQSASRASALAPEDQQAGCLFHLGQVVITQVLLIHVDYGLEIGINILPPLEPKSEPSTQFFGLIHQSTVMHNLTVRQLEESLKGLSRYTLQQQKFREQIREARERLERKCSIGMEHCLNSAMNWIHVLLQQQRKTEYAETRHSFATTNTARKIAQYFTKIVRQIEVSVDGANRQNVFLEMGFQFHREIFDRLQELPYTSDGVMILICDVNEYRECVRSMKVYSVVEIFDQLLSLCNLLVAQPENLLEMCGKVFAMVKQKEPITAFLRLRSDFRTASEFVRSYL
ncbi:hypothetical protein RvY_06818 [Ramazzottius varieornatus]|uniref:Exocyst complex component 5 n=1 Tax=Ramazzottius varieornatus TaxID=947166 RepID=A0A1D1V8I9_RAMVA|nr:hypothetical protein RvY_06818 [Ramazzottius varieornatus]